MLARHTNKAVATRVVRGTARAWLCAAVLALTTSVAPACDPQTSSGPDARIEIFAPDLAAPAQVERPWLESVADAHERADQALAAGDSSAAAAALEAVLAQAAPDSHAAIIVRLDLAARYGELSGTTPDGASDTIRVLEPMLTVQTALPLDPASARALVALGDAAGAVDDHALAAGSYARAVRVMSKLREAEAKRVLGDEAGGTQ